MAIFMPEAMNTFILFANLSLKPSVKVSVEHSVRDYVMGSFGKVQSNVKILGFIGDISYICVCKLTVNRR